MDHVADNPFFILELPATATAMEVERQGKLILARLELGLPSALHYPSPLGPRPRTADDVRRAMQALADPRRRLAAEPFALGAVAEPRPTLPPSADDDATPAAPTPPATPLIVVGGLPWWRP